MFFNIKDAIEKYNRNHHKKIHLTRSWGLFHLTPNGLAILNESDILVKKAALYQPPFQTNTADIRGMLKIAQSQSAIQGIHTLREGTKKIVEHTQILNNYEWENNTHQYLNTPNLWEQWIKKATNERERIWLKKLREQWIKHNEFGFHSSAGLLFLLSEIRKSIRHFIQAKSQLRVREKFNFLFSQFPKEIAISYNDFLNKQLKNLLDLQSRVIDEILLRLKVVDKTRLDSDHFTSYFIARLQKRNYINKNYKIPRFAVRLTPAIFTEFHQAVENYGNRLQITMLYQLQYNSPEKSVIKSDIHVIQSNRHRLLVPDCLMSFLPSNLNKPIWLFADNWNRWSFFKDHRQLFAELKKPLSDLSYNVEELTIDHPVCLQLCSKYQFLLKGRKVAQDIQIPWWHFQSKKMNEVWKGYLEKKIVELNRLIAGWIYDLIDKINDDPFLLADKKYISGFKLLFQKMYNLIENNISVADKEMLNLAYKSVNTKFESQAQQQIVSNFRLLSQKPANNKMPNQNIKSRTVDDVNTNRINKVRTYGSINVTV